MAKICPSCGTQAVDDQSLFCNKCGYPFPKTRPDSRTIVHRADDRLYETPADEPRQAPRPSRAPPGKRPARVKTSRRGAGPFGNLIAKKYLRLIYILGVIAITLVSLLGLSAGLPTTGTDAAMKAFTNTTAIVQTPASSPLFWIGLLIFGNLVWRVFCELTAVVYRIDDVINDSISGEGEPRTGDEAAGYGEEADGSMYTCPRCGKVVPADQLRECEHCGAQGCSNCIRMMGLLKKTMTCRDCFENK